MRASTSSVQHSRVGDRDFARPNPTRGFVKRKFALHKRYRVGGRDPGIHAVVENRAARFQGALPASSSSRGTQSARLESFFRGQFRRRSRTSYGLRHAARSRSATAAASTMRARETVQSQKANGRPHPKMSLTVSLQCRASVDCDLGAGDVPAFIREQEQHKGRDLLRRPHAFHWD